MRQLKSISIFLACTVTVISCQDNLPGYEEPEILLEAKLYLENSYNFGDLIGGSPQFGVEVWNVTDTHITSDYVLSPPYEVKVAVTVYLARNPARNITLSIQEVFTEPEDQLEPGYRIRVLLAVPRRDSERRRWNADDPDEMRHKLVFQGKVEIPKLDLTMHTAPVECYLYYDIP